MEAIKQSKKIKGNIIKARNTNQDPQKTLQEVEDSLVEMISSLQATISLSENAIKNHIEMTDFPKLECPFERRNFSISKKQWKEHGRRLGLRSPEVYLVVNEVKPGYEWVFEDPDTVAIEKLDGTNVKVLLEKSFIKSVQNRKNIVDALSTKGTNPQIMEGIYRSALEDLLPKDGEVSGEIIGPKLQGNPYNLKNHLYYPFDVAYERLRFSYWDRIEIENRNIDNISAWFRYYLKSIFMVKYHKITEAEAFFAEGVVFYNLRRKAEGLSWRAKLRRDMFPWFYTEHLDIQDYAKSCEDCSQLRDYRI